MIDTALTVRNHPIINRYGKTDFHLYTYFYDVVHTCTQFDDVICVFDSLTQQPYTWIYFFHMRYVKSLFA